MNSVLIKLDYFHDMNKLHYQYEYMVSYRTNPIILIIYIVEVE